jgi:hypothetical protein
VAIAPVGLRVFSQTAQVLFIFLPLNVARVQKPQERVLCFSPVSFGSLNFPYSEMITFVFFIPKTFMTLRLVGNMIVLND